MVAPVTARTSHPLCAPTFHGSDATVGVAFVHRAFDGDDVARRQLVEHLLDSVRVEVSWCLARWAAHVRRDPRQEVGDLVHEIVIELLENDGRELRRWDPS